MQTEVTSKCITLQSKNRSQVSLLLLPGNGDNCPWTEAGIRKSGIRGFSLGLGLLLTSLRTFIYPALSYLCSHHCVLASPPFPFPSFCTVGCQATRPFWTSWTRWMTTRVRGSWLLRIWWWASASISPSTYKSSSRSERRWARGWWNLLCGLRLSGFVSALA